MRLAFTQSLTWGEMGTLRLTSCLGEHSLSSADSIFSAELSEQIEKALQLEEERRRAQEEAERLEADRMAALRAKEELERQAQDQIKSQEQLVGIAWVSRC